MTNNNQSTSQHAPTAVDSKRLARSRVIGIGGGGGRECYENFARCGVGEFVFIDPDIVTESNIGTQQVYQEEIGRAKVDCTADKILQINPSARINVYQKPIEDIDDSEFALLAFAPDEVLGMFEKPLCQLDRGEQEEAWFMSEFVKMAWRGSAALPGPEVTLLCGFTDSFYAQARVNRLALQFGLPSLCCQLYQFGLGGEITFTFPGVTPACQRCILSPRYKAYLEQGYQNTVTSEGAPIFATSRINALCGMIALSLLHHGTNHPLWGQMLTRIGNRTLVQVRIHPDAQLSIFNRVFAGGDTQGIFFDEAVWLPQEADPQCPDCGGTGDLRNAMGRFADTRLIHEQR